MWSRPLALASLALLAAPAVATAHIQLSSPAPRSLEQKQQHCGPAGSTRGPNVNVYAPGQMIEVRWLETINHPGYYRISFDVDGQDFTIPPAPNNTTASTNVLVDLIADRATTMANNTYTQMVQLPNVTCENCTLQLIQLMTDKPPYTTDALSDDIYFQCADIALRAPGGDAGPDAAVSIDAAVGPDGGIGAQDLEGGCGCRTSQAQPGGIVALGLALAAAARRRRRA